MSAALATKASTEDSVRGLAELRGATVTAVGGIESTLERARSLVSDATAQLMTSFGGLRGTLEEQTAILGQISAALGRVGAASFTAAAGRMVNDFVDEIVRVSNVSVRIVEQLQVTSDHVNAIIARAERIDDLARESRFIALNARIETQRAGEAGRTFKVVADEIKRLASASAEISTQICSEVELCFQSLQQTRQSAVGLAGHDMSVIHDSRAVLVETVERFDTVNKSVESALAKVTTAVAEAIRALQFEDMVTQLLSEAMRRVKSLSNLMLEAISVVEERREAGPERLRDIARDLRDLGKVGSISQRDLQEGSVELF